MKKHNSHGSSDYRLRGFTSLHIKVDTKTRLNLAKTQIFARDGKAISHDDLINHLLDHHAAAVIAEPPVADAVP